MLATSVEPADLHVNGVPATDVVLTDGNTLVFTLDPASFSGDGVYSVDIQSGSLDDLQGNTLAETFVATFELDTQGPRISGIAWNGEVFPASGVLPAGPLSLEATFSEELFIFASPRRGPFSAGKDDVVLTDTDTGQIYEPTTVQFDANTDTFAAEFDQELPEGKYSLRLVSGQGCFRGRRGQRVGW